MPIRESGFCFGHASVTQSVTMPTVIQLKSAFYSWNVTTAKILFIFFISAHLSIGLNLNIGEIGKT